MCVLIYYIYILDSMYMNLLWSKFNVTLQLTNTNAYIFFCSFNTHMYTSQYIFIRLASFNFVLVKYILITSKTINLVDR